MPSKNNSGIQIPEEDLRAMGEAVSKVMGDAAITITKFSTCVGEFLAEATAIMRKITATLHEVYLANGAPYGDSQVGFMLWVKEEQERSESLLSHSVSSQDAQKHARKEGENG